MCQFYNALWFTGTMDYSAKCWIGGGEGMTKIPWPEEAFRRRHFACSSASLLSNSLPIDYLEQTIHAL